MRKPHFFDRLPEHVESIRVLVVDDNLDNAETLCHLLGLFGHKACQAHSGAEALALADEFRPQVVFLDLAMPGMDGYEVAERLRNSCGNEIFIAALTGYGSEQVQRRCRDAQFDYYLQKPCEPERLQKLLAFLALSMKQAQLVG